MHPVESLAAALESHVHYVLSTAAASPPGGGPPWDAVLAHYRVPAFPYDERAASVGNLRMARGALPGEVRAVLESLRAWASGEVARLRQDPANAFMPAAPLEQRLAALVTVELPRYELAIGLTPLPASPAPAPALGPAPLPVGPSLGSIFANAQQTSKEVPWANQTYKQVASLTCVHCGGTQEQPLDFMCKYCRRPIAGALKPT
jgi:hypothetical protein